MSVVGQLSYEVQEGVAVVKGLDDKSAVNLVIPGTVTIDGAEYPVKKIGETAFQEAGFETCEIPTGLEEICKGAFHKCQSLKELIIPAGSSLKAIGEGAFHLATIESIILPESLETLGIWAFNQCSKLKVVQFPHNPAFQTIADGSFAQTLLEKVVIPPQVVTVDRFAFDQCHQLVSVEFEDFENSKCEVVNSACFRSCDSLVEFHFPPLCKNMGAHTFKDATKLSKVTFVPGSPMGQLGGNSFQNTAIEEMVVPTNCDMIDSFCFCECKKLKKVTFENLLESKCYRIGYCTFMDSTIEGFEIGPAFHLLEMKAFYNCPNLRYFRAAKDSTCHVVMGEAFAKTPIEEVVIPSCEMITKDAFAECKNIKTVRLTVPGQPPLPKNHHVNIEEGTFSGKIFLALPEGSLKDDRRFMRMPTYEFK